MNEEDMNYKGIDLAKVKKYAATVAIKKPDVRAKTDLTTYDRVIESVGLGLKNHREIADRIGAKWKDVCTYLKRAEKRGKIVKTKQGKSGYNGQMTEWRLK